PITAAYEGLRPLSGASQTRARLAPRVMASAHLRQPLSGGGSQRTHCELPRSSQSDDGRSWDVRLHAGSAAHRANRAFPVSGLVAKLRARVLQSPFPGGTTMSLAVDAANRTRWLMTRAPGSLRPSIVNARRTSPRRGCGVAGCEGGMPIDL